MVPYRMKSCAVVPRKQAKSVMVPYRMKSCAMVPRKQAKSAMVPYRVSLRLKCQSKIYATT